MAEPIFQQLTERVQQLEERVAALERELAVAARAQVAQETAALPIDQPSAQPVAPVQDLESRFGLRLVNQVGAVTLILGIAFFFRYAIENNWIGEGARVMLGAAAGILLLLGGEFAFRRGARVFAQGITGAGAAALFLAFYAAFAVYHLVPFGLAFALLTGVTGAAAALALRYDAQAIAWMALLGGVLAPVELADPQRGAWFVPVYMIVLDAGFLALASRRGWRGVEWLALLATAPLCWNFGPAQLRVVLPIYYALFATSRNVGVFLAAHVLFVTRTIALPEQSIGFSAYLVVLSAAGTAVLQWRGWNRFAWLLVAAAGLTWWLRDSAGGLNLAHPLLTLSLLHLIFLAAAVRHVWFAASVPQTGALAAMPLNAALCFTFCYQILSVNGGSAAAQLALIMAILYLAIALRLQKLPQPNLAVTMSTGIAVAFFTLAIPIRFRAYRVSIAWALEGAALAWIAERRRATWLARIALVVLLSAVTRFFWLDLALYAHAQSHALIGNVRFLTAIAVATALFFAAHWSRGDRRQTWGAGVVGHLVLLAAITLEVSDWAVRFHSGNARNASSAALSIAFAAYAVVLVALGAQTRTAGNRYLGLGLIALVVLKLYLYDVWQLDAVYRFTAFAALGALLLVTSFLYSRFGASVARWLQAGGEIKSDGVSAIHPPPRPE